MGPVANSGTSRLSPGPEWQHALTVAVPIDEARLVALRDLLNPIGEDISNSSGKADGIRFGDLVTVHFMRWVILEGALDLKQQAIPPQLVLETNFDGDLDGHLTNLIEVTGATLFRIYSHCKGFPASPTPGTAKDYLLRHRVPESAFYVGTVGLSVGQIRRDQELRDGIEGFLDLNRNKSGWADRPPADIRKDIRDFVAGDAQLQWAVRNPPTDPWFGMFLRKALLWVVPAILVLTLLVLPPAAAQPALGHPWILWQGIWIGILIVIVLLALWILTRQEKRDPQDPAIENMANARSIARNEDHQVQNQMTDVVLVKPTWFRLSLLRLVLGAIDFLAWTKYTGGTLAGIPSIHFARWYIVDGGRRLVFHSNFDGSWENYLDDFIDKAADGLTAVWSNAQGFPRSSMLTGKGARDERRFKAYVRNSQVFTNVWYSAYPSLSVQNIHQNAQIRSMLARENPSLCEIRDWLKLL